jgi:hypothetical protein
MENNLLPKYFDNYCHDIEFINEIIRFKPTGKETDIIKILFKKNNISDILPIIQKYVNIYNGLLYYELCNIASLMNIFSYNDIMLKTFNILKIKHLEKDIRNNINITRSMKTDLSNLTLLAERNLTLIEEKKKYINKKKIYEFEINTMKKNILDMEKKRILLVNTLYDNMTITTILDIIGLIGIHSLSIQDIYDYRYWDMSITKVNRFLNNNEIKIQIQI